MFSHWFEKESTKVSKKKLKKLLDHQKIFSFFAKIFNDFFIEFYQTSTFWKNCENFKKLKTKISIFLEVFVIL